MQSVALVTGANRGIGFEIAQGLARQGYFVIATARHPAEARPAFIGQSVEVWELDQRYAGSVAHLAERLRRAPGRLDVLVNNAGVMLDSGRRSALALDPDVLRNTLDVNLVGALRVTQACAPLLRESPAGRIVNVSSSLASLDGMGSGTPAYRMSKTALNALTRILAAEFAGTTVKVNAMCPGWCRTEIGGPQAPRSAHEGADTALWLASLPEDGPSGGFFRDREPLAW
ncbi:MAG: SDR family oxidoreductase [Rhodocyclaceae bacterium]|nr:SDR family oxidoreductase [Rhodocyclaceae bacterium]MBX3668723.1 SDR family oxidoreductase [Rhodocyclaceae bacterium]